MRRLIRFLILSVLLTVAGVWSCSSSSPTDPTAPTAQDRAYEQAFSNNALVLYPDWPDSSEVVFWMFLDDGTYNFRHVGATRWISWEHGTWWVRGDLLFLDRTEGAWWNEREWRVYAHKPMRYALSFLWMAPTLGDPVAQVILKGRHTYQVVPLDEWEMAWEEDKR